MVQEVVQEAMASQNGKTRVLIAAKERGLRDQLRRFVVSNDKYEVAGTAVDGQEAVQLAVLMRPDITIINADLPIYSGLEASEMIGLAAPEVRNIIIGDGEADTHLLRKAMKSGARAYLASPVVESELMDAIESLARIGERRESPEFATATDPALLPKLVVVTGGKGGVGKTSIAASLSMCLAQAHPNKVALIDMYTQFGDVSTMLNIQPKKSLVELAMASEEVDLETLESYMSEHETGLKVLVTALNIQPIDALSVGYAESVIHALKRKYTYIVVDLPPILHATTLYVLSHCYRLVLVTTMFDLPGIRDGKELYDTVVGTYVPEEKVTLVANRVSKYDRLTPEDLERLFGRPISVQVPNDRRLVNAVNQGVPFVKVYAKSPLVAAVQKIEQELALEPAAASG